MLTETLLTPDKKRLEAVLRCTKCKATAEDDNGRAGDGEVADFWLRQHLLDSPRCA